ncbi:zinc finger/helix-turn-helix protein [Firmicutes bacterium CAG:238]|nr:zinc finger/helix-turn-helix protein [Firmicutes bacterium CAG:238]
MTREMTIGKIFMDCPICGNSHEVEIRERKAKILIKGEEIVYQEKFFFCANSDDEECEFQSGKMMNENLSNARNAYREKHGLLTSEEIVEIRRIYHLSQVELSKLLGWGEATISRYESKAIQDEVYDNVLQNLKNNPASAFEYLEKNKAEFSLEKYLEIKTAILQKIESYGKEYLARQSLESEYAKYTEKCDANGNTILDIDKIEGSISYLAEKIDALYKVKLMKLLWYIDALSFKFRGCAITGLVYTHQKMGALPIGHYKVMNLENVLFDEIEDERYDVMYRFKGNEKIEKKCLTQDDYAILDCVINKFGSYSGKELMEYMHKESAYLNTEMNEIIPFSLAKEIRDFN